MRKINILINNYNHNTTTTIEEKKKKKANINNAKTFQLNRRKYL